MTRDQYITWLFLIALLVAAWHIYAKWGKDGEGFGEAKVPLFVISLERRPERKQLIMDRIRDDPRYYVAEVTAVDGKRHLTVEKFIDGHGQIGCFLSHIGIWGRLSQMGSGVEWALVLEDDADVNLPEDWDRVVEMAVKNTPLDWEILWIGVLNIVSPEKNIEMNSHVNLNNSIIWGTHAYLIKKSAAQKLYSRMSHYENTHKLADFESLEPVDIYLSHNEDVPLRQYVLSHDLIGQRSMGSDTNVDDVANKDLS